MDLHLTGKRALVTGSTSGIGRGIALLLAAEGVSVVVHGRDADRAGHVAEEIRQAGGLAAIALGDLSTDAGAADVSDAALSAFGGIDILVNNVGVGGSPHTNWLDVTPDEWMQNYQANVLAPLRMIRALVPGMKERGWGRVVNVGSGVALRPNPAFPAYGPNKAAVVNMTVSLSLALANTGITVNTLSPGTTLTEGMQAGLVGIAKSRGWPETNLEQIERRGIKEIWPNSVGRMGRVHELAAGVVFLASEQAAFFTGINLRCDGGYISVVN